MEGRGSLNVLENDDEADPTQIQGQGRDERVLSILALSIGMTGKWGFERHAGSMGRNRKYLHFTPRAGDAAA